MKFLIIFEDKLSVHSSINSLTFKTYNSYAPQHGNIMKRSTKFSCFLDFLHIGIYIYIDLILCMLFKQMKKYFFFFNIKRFAKEHHRPTALCHTIGSWLRDLPPVRLFWSKCFRSQRVEHKMPASSSEGLISITCGFALIVVLCLYLTPFHSRLIKFS